MSKLAYFISLHGALLALADDAWAPLQHIQFSKNLSFIGTSCRYDVVVALDNDIKRDIIEMVQPEWHSYYDARVCMLDQFSDYLGSDILKTGGTAVLESELSGIIKPVIQESKAIPDLLRPSLHKGTSQARVLHVLTLLESPV